MTETTITKNSKENEFNMILDILSFMDKLFYFRLVNGAGRFIDNSTPQRPTNKSFAFSEMVLARALQCLNFVSIV